MVSRLGALLVQSVLLQAAVYVLRPTISYRALELGVSSAWLGILGASFAVVPLFIALPVGRLTDRVGERAPLLTGAVGFAVASIVLLTLAHSIVGLLAGSVILGAGHLLCLLAGQTLVANASGPGEHDRAFGHYTFAAALGQTLGPLLVAGFGGSARIPATQHIFAASAGLCMLVVVAALAVRVPRHERPVSRTTQRRVMREVLGVQGVGRAVSVGVAVLVAVDIITVYLPALGTERNLDAGLVGTLLVIRAASSMVSRFFLGRLVRELGRRRLLIVSIVTAAGALALLPVPLPYVVLAGLLGLSGIGLGVGQPVLMSWLAEAAPAGLRGTAMSLRLSGNRLGQTVIPSAVGLVAASAGASGVLWATAGMLAVAGAAVRSAAVDSSQQDDSRVY